MAPGPTEPWPYLSPNALRALLREGPLPVRLRLDPDEAVQAIEVLPVAQP